MKKFTVLAIIGLLIMALGAPVYAQAPKTEWKISGFMDMNAFWYRNNLDGQGSAGFSATNPIAANTIFGVATGGNNGRKLVNGPEANKTLGWQNQRMQLKFDAAVGKALSATIFLEANASRWGSTSYPGTIANNSNWNMGYFDADQPGLGIKNAYFDIALPYVGIPIPMSARVGVQPLTVRPDFVTQTDAAGITGALKMDPVTLNLLWFKAVQGSDGTPSGERDWVDHNSNIYGVRPELKVGQSTISGYALFYDFGTYPTTANEAAAAATSPGGNNSYLYSFAPPSLQSSGGSGSMAMES